MWAILLLTLVNARNTGPNTATGIMITDIIPEGLTGVTVTPSIGTYYNNIWVIPSLANGATATLTITGNAGTTMAGTTTTNTAIRTAQDQYNSQSAVTTASVYTPAVDIVVDNYPWYYDTLTDTYVNRYNCGNTPVMIADVFNSGPDDATGVVVKYTFGNGFEYIGCNTQGVGTTTYDSNTRTITWNIGYMPQNGYAVMKVYLFIKQTGDNTPNLNTTAILTNVDQSDSNNTNNNVSYQINTPTSADIQVNQTKTTYTGTDGKQYVTYTITVKNNGPNNATGLTITDKLPTGLTFNSANTHGAGNYNSSTGVWNIGNFNYGDAPKTLTIIAEITTTETIKNKAYKSAQSQNDWNYNNNAQTTTINPGAQNVDIVVDNYPWYYDTLTDTYVNRYNCGNTPVMIADVFNSGPDDATGVVVKYTFGNGFEYIGCNTQGVGTTTYDSNTRTITWNIGYMPQNGYAVMKVYLFIKQTGDNTPNLNTTAILTNVDQSDSNNTNNNVSYQINTPTSADIQVNQTKTTYTGTDGKQYVTYTITVKNNGPNNATGLTITDKLPTGLTFNSANTHGAGNYNSSTGVWNIGNFNYGDAPKTLTIIAEITTTETIKNKAYKSAQSQNDWNYNNNAQTTIITP